MTVEIMSSVNCYTSIVAKRRLTANIPIILLLLWEEDEDGDLYVL